MTLIAPEPASIGGHTDARSGSTAAPAHASNGVTPPAVLRGVGFRYSESARRPRGAGERQWLLRDVDLCVRPGDRVGIVGDNGSGKSTIAKLMLGLVEPVEGAVELFGVRASWHGHFPLLGYVGDPGYNADELGLPSGYLVEEVLDTFRELWKSTASPEHHRDLELKLCIDALRGRSIDGLSAGERKRLMIFLALAKRPRLLILDEPLDGLDGGMKPIVLNLLESVTARPDVALIYIAHDDEELALLTRHVYRLSGGRLVREEPPTFEVVFDDGRSPQTGRLTAGHIRALVRRGLSANGTGALSLSVRDAPSSGIE